MNSVHRASAARAAAFGLSAFCYNSAAKDQVREERMAKADEDRDHAHPRGRLPEWYQQVIGRRPGRKSPVRGCMVIKPWG